MVSLKLFVCLLAAFVAPSVATKFVWKGGNMDFSNVDNWNGSYAPIAGNNPCSTTFGGDGTVIISNLAGATYNIGQSLNLPTDGTLQLASDGTVLNFADNAHSNCGTQQSVWTGGLAPEQRNDFYCHTNWNIDLGSTLGIRAATDVPCAGDTVFFDTTKSYHTSINPVVPLVSVTSITLNPQLIITSNVSSELQKGLPQVNLISSSTIVYIGNDALSEVCIPMNQYLTDSNGIPNKCLCSSSCPTPEMIAAADARARANILSAANQTLTAMNTYYVRSFTGTMNAASLSVSQNVLGNALHNPSDPTNMNISRAIAAALLDLPAAAVTGVTVSISSDNSTVTVTGNINATAGSLMPIGFSSLDPPNNIVWSSTTTAIPLNVTRTQMIVQSSLSAEIFLVVATILANRFATQTNQQTATVQSIINALTGATDPTAAVNAVTSATCLSTCGSDCTSCLATLQTALTNAGVTNPAAVTNDVSTLAGSGYSTITGTISTIVNTAIDAIAATNSSAQVAMQQYMLTSPTIYIGRYRAQSGQLWAIASQNYANVVRDLTNAINGFQIISTVSGLRFSYVDSVPAAPSARRRRAVTETSSALAVVFNYNTSCLPLDTACQQAFSAVSNMGSLIQQRLDNTFNLLSFEFGLCSSGQDLQCVTAAALATCMVSFNNGKNLSMSRVDGYNVIYNLTRCGPSPTYPNGTCLVPYTFAVSNAQQLAATLQCGVDTTVAPASPTTAPNGIGAASGASSGGSGSIIPIAAAAGGGALLLVVVVILLMRRKRNARGPAKKTDDRTVVAFENPMYDDPARNPVSQPTYDAAAPHDGEGLYDEPAFNQSAQKANPVYQSTEDLAAGADQNYAETTYGDAAPGKADGYLDVAPGAAEDVGYLDGVEKR